MSDRRCVAMFDGVPELLEFGSDVQVVELLFHVE